MSVTPRPSVAYFCMEYGLSHELPIYSGGLGVLAGDHMKSAGDLGAPIVGIGLLWGEGYTRQRICGEGKPVDEYPPTPREALQEVPGMGISVRVGDRDVACRVFRVARHLRGTLYLLEPERVADRWITRRLYGGGQRDRLAQELLLGVGGVQLIDALRARGTRIDLLHFNEGHAVFAGLELVRRELSDGKALDDAIAAVRQRVVFTTHTPVAAGNEEYRIDVMRRAGAHLGLSSAALARIGGVPFSMTVAGLRLSRAANGVAELHGQTARKMWRDVEDAAPIIHITNGVHTPTWQDPAVREAGSGADDPASAEALWVAHQKCKRALVSLIEERTGTALQIDRLLIGFARRAAAYKRADLIFGEPGRLARLFDQGVQLVFSGKAHPRDAAGKAMVARLVAAARRWPDRVVFLEDYEMGLGAALTRGCDVWLNNPRRPLEASGTSGMKAAMNGVLNLSILDGWWPEGCRHGETGWQIGEPHGDDPVDEDGCRIADARDRRALYRVLEEEVVPCYYRDRPRWVRMMRASIAMSQWRFSSDRMVEEYYARMYAPPSS